MAFTQFSFFIFFTIVYILLWINRWIFSRKKVIFTKINKIILLIASYLFTGLADWRFCISLILTTIVVYIVAIIIEKRNKSEKNSKVILIIGVVAVLLQLGVFKYFNFFASSMSNLLGKDFVILNLIIPIGISFYSFSAISYIIDVFRKKYEPTHNFIDVALFISFFPKLTSGPIVRPNKFFKQLDSEHHVSLKNFEVGIQIVLTGIFKKMVLADHLAIFVNDVFSNPNAFTGATILLAMISYSLQIYFDFSGYSDIAIGFSKMLGFNFDKNFDIPYVSLNPTEFWKRWHISLSSWLQEYLYYSLGGNRCSKIRAYMNLLLTMLIGGLWHGANWTFIIWGGINGIALIVHKMFMKWKIKVFGDKNAGNTLWKICSVLLNFVFVTTCWVFFRADSLQNALDMFLALFNGTNKISQMFSWTFLAMALMLLEIFIALYRRKKNKGYIQAEYIRLNLTQISHLAIFFTLVGITIMLAYVGNTAFIYGNF